jgi:hypothetical protein
MPLPADIFRVLSSWVHYPKVPGQGLFFGVFELFERLTSVDVRDDQRGFDPSAIVENDPVDTTVFREDALHAVSEE